MRVPMMMTPAEAMRLDEWQHAYRLANRTAAIKEMMRMAYEARPATAAPPPGAGPAADEGRGGVG